MTSVIHIVGSIIIALSIVSLMMSANYQMAIDQAETVLDSQVQGDAEILKSVLREELKQVGVDVPIDTDVFVTALSTPERIAYVTAAGGTLRRVELYTQSDDNSQSLRLMKRTTTLVGEQAVYVEEIPVRGLIQLGFSYWSQYDTQTTQPNNNTRYVGFDVQVQSTETANGNHAGSMGSDRVILRSLLYRET